jgi:hypothetical protein
MRTVQSAWGALDGKRRALLTRCEKYAGFTLPQICTPPGYNENNTELQHDYQSVGAQAVNNLANKLVLALFAPSRPFFRLDLPSDLLQRLLSQGGITQSDLENKLAVGEKAAVKLLDSLGSRPKLYEAVKHLIVTGNVLLKLGAKKTDPLRVLGLKKYVVKRNMEGKWIDLIVKECVLFDELDPSAQAFLQKLTDRFNNIDPNSPETVPKVDHFTRLTWNSEQQKYVLTQHVDEWELADDKFRGAYTERECPYRPLTWELGDENDYGTGLVEQCTGDFAALSILSEAEVQAAVLASEFRWLVNPAGMTKPEDLQSSGNGAALPGVQNDVIPLSAAAAGVGQALQIVDNINTKYVNRIGQVFVLTGSVIRDAERVTAEEVRLVANDLETSLGGTYSRLAIDFQLPLAFWLVKMSGVNLNGTGIEPTIITGLDALSRNGDLENMKLCLQDLAGVSTLPPAMIRVLKMDNISTDIFSARGIDSTRYVKTQQEQQADDAREQQAALAQQVARPVAQAAVNQQGT